MAEYGYEMFCLGETVIDKKRRTAPTVRAIIEKSSPTIYVLENDEGALYLESEDNLIPYNKNWFDEQEAK